MRITTERVLTADFIAQIYPTYAHAWDRLLIHAAARHVLTEHEFTDEMLDERIEKFILRDDDDSFLGMATLTNDMSAIPWINPQHYAFRYPDAVGRNALFYLGYVFAERSLVHPNLLKVLLEVIDQRLSERRGVVGFDICSFNIEHGIGRRLASLLNSSDRIDTLDNQTYFVADYRGLTEPSVPTSSLADSYNLLTLADRPEAMDDIWSLMKSRWPAFTLFGRAGHGIDLEKLLLRIPEQQILLFDAYDALCGVGFAVPLRWDGSVEGLPGGWDDAIRQAAALVEEDASPTASCALSVTISPDARGYGLAGRIWGGLSGAAERVGSRALLAPVRPSLKSSYPLIPMTQYLTWHSDHGDAFDPWLRIHLRHGGQILGIAEESMIVDGTIAEWQEWLDMPLPASGEYVIAGGLVPLSVDLESDHATYREPNVWVYHPLQPDDDEWPESGDIDDAGSEMTDVQEG